MLLRTYGGLFEQFTAIDEGLLAKKLNSNKSEIKNEIQQYQVDGLLIYNNRERSVGLRFLMPREDQSLINRISRDLEQYNRIKKEKYKALTAFLNNNTVCRNRMLLSYFGEALAKDCGLCDICLSKKRLPAEKENISLAERIIDLLNEHKSLSSKEMETLLIIESKALLSELQLLLDTGKITLNSHFKFQVAKK